MLSAGTKILCRLGQLENEFGYKSTVFPCIITDVKPVQPEKASFPIN